MLITSRRVAATGYSHRFPAAFSGQPAPVGDSLVASRKTETLGLIPKSLPVIASTGKAELLHKAGKVRQRYDLPAVSAAILQQGETTTAATGERARGGIGPVTENDKFHLGSCTKAMTATMLARLVEAGSLSWESTVGEIFPELADALSPDLKAATLAMLTSHTSGLPAGFPPEIWKRMYHERIPRSELVRLVASDPGTTIKPGLYLYSNVGYLFAGAMAEKVTGRTWEDLMRELLFAPLGMSSAGFGPAGVGNPQGHDAQGHPVAVDWESWKSNPGSRPPDNPEELGPAGTVHSTLTDWARFVRLHLERPEDFLSKASWSRLHTPEPGRVYTPGGWLAQQGELLHDGSNTYNYCLVRLRPEQGEAVMVATNQGARGDQACAELASQLL